MPGSRTRPRWKATASSTCSRIGQRYLEVDRRGRARATDLNRAAEEARAPVPSHQLIAADREPGERELTACVRLCEHGIRGHQDRPGHVGVEVAVQLDQAGFGE